MNRAPAEAPAPENSLAWARAADAADPLRAWRDQFHHPVIEGRPVLYFTGNSLGLQPRTVAGAVEAELEHWAQLGVEGHFHAPQPWYSYHEALAGPSARIVGALPSEVVCMNTLTVNLHLLFVSFYRPTASRFRIISEAGMFPSDHYLLETQIRFHGFDPDLALVEVAPREGEFAVRHEDILAAIDQHRDSVALVFFGAINYFNGQWFDLPGITAAAHQAGAIAGFDLAHAAGNVPLSLHDWDVDFAAWCTYKYLNAGPGNVGGAFVHQRHGADFSLPRFGGWWGHDKDRRFLMEPGFQPMPGAEGWQLSNGQILGMAALRAALEVFDQVGMDAIRRKSLALTGFLEFVLRSVVDEFPRVGLELITPADERQRGAQLSLRLAGIGRDFFQRLRAADVLADYREPDVIRVSPAPLYNSFEDVWRLGVVLRHLLRQGVGG